MANEKTFRRPLIGTLVVFAIFASLFVIFTSIFPPNEFDETGSGSDEPPSWEVPGSVSCYLPFSRIALTTQPAPWKSLPMIPSNSEQRQPFYIGLNPRQLSLKSTAPPSTPSHPELPNVLKTFGEYFLNEMVKVVRTKAKTSSPIWFEMYPAIDDWGQFTWSIPRWKLPNSTTEANCWQWLNEEDFDFDTNRFPYNLTIPFLPINYIPGQSEEDMASVFDDFLQFDDLYQKRVFGDCVWTKNDDTDAKVDTAWLGDDLIQEYRHKVLAAAEQNNFLVCRVVPQPARFNGSPISFFVEVSSVKSGGNTNVRWPTEIKWVNSPTPSSPFLYTAVTQTSNEDFPFGNTTEMEYLYMNDIRNLDGEASVQIEEDGKNNTITFVRKNSVQEDNQLEEVVMFLEQRYQQLGVSTERQTFRWHGINQFNLVAFLPALDSSSRQCSSTNSSVPLIIVDHIDTAFAEDVYDDTGKRVSAPGADDNASGTAALLRIAEYFAERGEKTRQIPWCRSVWLVHLTGEEYPADDLGARYFASNILSANQDVAGFIVLDMIGHPLTVSDTIFQVSTGHSQDSLRLGETVLQTANETITAQKLNGVLRLWGDPKAYLFNTDGLVFMEMGWPVVLLNEHINLEEGFDRTSYHTSTDLSDQIQPSYAVSITQITINSILKLTGPPSRPK